MKPLPILTAVLVCVTLYFAILDRDTLVQFAGRFAAQEPQESQANETSTDDTAPDAIRTAQAENGAAAQPSPDIRDDRLHVRVRHSIAQPAETAVILRGRTEAMRQVEVAAETSGRIVSDPIRAGASVDEGQLLCEIDPGTRIADLAEAEARFLEAEARLAEAEASVMAATIDSQAANQLSESGFASETRAASASATLASAQAAAQAAVSGIRSAEAAVIRAQEDIDRLRIRAPFAGLLESDTAELGSFMQPGALCATIIALDPIKLVGFVPEARVNRVQTGADSHARLSTGAEVNGVVTFLSRSADPRTRTFRVEILVPNPDVTIRDGQSADIMIQTDGTPAHLLPASAMVLDNDDTLGVWIVEDGIVHFAPVMMLRDTARGVWLAGLPEAVDVITIGQGFVTEGMPVRITYESETAEAEATP